MVSWEKPTDTCTNGVKVTAKKKTKGVNSLIIQVSIRSIRRQCILHNQTQVKAIA